MKEPFVTGFRVALAFCLALSVSLAYAQHGGGGHGGGGHGGGHFGGGHFGGRGHAHADSGRYGGSAKPHGITRIPPFSAVRLFGHHHHHRHFREPFIANGLFVGGFDDCGFWDWNCGWGWDDSDFDVDNWMRPASSPTAPARDSTGNAPRPVAVLYFKSGYSVGVTQYWLENGDLHYFTTYGGENVIPRGEIDLQRTIDENAGNGPPFVLRPKQPTPPSENH